MKVEDISLNCSLEKCFKHCKYLHFEHLKYLHNFLPRGVVKRVSKLSDVVKRLEYYFSCTLLGRAQELSDKPKVSHVFLSELQDPPLFLV
jgi:hypothetical protein